MQPLSVRSWVLVTILALALGKPVAAQTRAVGISFQEGLPSHERWPMPGESLPRETLHWEGTHFLLPRLPLRYDPWGIRDAWRGPVLTRLTADVVLPPGKRRFLIRARALSRLWVNGNVIAQTAALTKSPPDGEEPVIPLTKPPLPGLRPAAYGQQEAFGEAEVPADGKCQVVLETLVGGAKLRAETSELCVAVQDVEGKSYAVLTPGSVPLPLTDAAVEPELVRLEKALARFDDTNRRTLAKSQSAFWTRRHTIARAWTEAHPVPTSAIDTALKTAQAPLSEDTAFLRRLSLDTVGVPSSEAELRAFLADKSPDKRARAIERLLADPRRADHEMPGWLDLLAENPSLINPALNTTGPFRWFLYDSLRDNKPLDRLVTELLLLRGSPHTGGSAGFALAGENDAPFATKGQIVASAFLGIELGCARCHDAPYHSNKQRELYALAALLERKPVTVPKTSSVPAAFFEKKARESLIQVTLKPGEPVAPAWPFATVTGVADSPALDALTEAPSDSRERLAALITAPQNRRFAQVAVNRLWKRLMGTGFVEPSSDWENREVQHPALLAWLAQELVAHDYDLTHVQRLILRSRAYQSATRTPRRLSAEQLVDSLYTATGQAMDTEELTFDPTGRRPEGARITLGRPQRAWMLASLTNERDRPSLSLPRAQCVTDMLEAFGWKGDRQAPRAERESAPHVLQPGVLANSTLATSLTRAAYDSPLARLALTARSPEALVDTTFLRFLSRFPTPAERQRFALALRPGFTQRRVAGTKPPTAPPLLPRITWFNHLQAETTTIAQELERRTQQGPPADPRLRSAWRETYEDFIWSLINTREFVWTP